MLDRICRFKREGQVCSPCSYILSPQSLLLAHLVSIPAERACCDRITQVLVTIHLRQKQLSAECATWVTPRTSWVLLVPCEMMFQWIKGKCVENNIRMWQQWMISQLWAVESCTGCEQLHRWYSWITDSVLFPFRVAGWEYRAIALDIWSCCRRTAQLPVGVSPLKRSWYWRGLSHRRFSKRLCYWGSITNFLLNMPSDQNNKCRRKCFSRALLLTLAGPREGNQHADKILCRGSLLLLRIQ